MRAQVTLEQAAGKVIERSVNFGFGNALFLLFTDDTMAVLTAVSGSDDIGIFEVSADADHFADFILHFYPESITREAIMSQSDLDKIRDARRYRNDARLLENEWKQYQRLKAKFEPE